MVEPYIEAVSFIGSNEDILKESKQIPKLKKKFSDSEQLQDYIQTKIYNIIYDYDQENEEEEKKSRLYQDEPDRIFNFIFTNLHKLFGGNNINSEGLKSAEINNENAIEIFNKLAEENKTIISELYYGKKQVAKFCKSCKMTIYSYIYQKVIALDLSSERCDIDLENEIINLDFKENKKEFCPICSKERNLVITKSITEKPKIMIIVLKNISKNIRINYNRYMFDEQYELIGVETTQSPKKNIFCLFAKCFKPEKTGYQFLSDLSLELEFNKIKKENPYVLYYKKKEKKPKKKNKRGKNGKIKIDLKSNEEFLEKNKSISIKKKNNKKKQKSNEDDIKIAESGFKVEQKNSININNINNNINKNGNDIVLYFKFNESKELYLDTKDNRSFRVILQEFEKKWEIKLANIKFNGKKINLNNTPKEIGIKDKATILVADDINI